MKKISRFSFPLFLKRKKYITNPSFLPHWESTALYNFTSHTFTLHFLFQCAHSKSSLASRLFSPLLAVCFVRYFRENWYITNGDEDLSNCENDEFEVRTLLRWRLCRVS